MRCYPCSRSDLLPMYPVCTSVQSNTALQQIACDAKAAGDVGGGPAFLQQGDGVLLELWCERPSDPFVAGHAEHLSLEPW